MVLSLVHTGIPGSWSALPVPRLGFSGAGWGLRIGLFHTLFVILMYSMVEDTGLEPPKERIHLRFLWNIGRETQILHFFPHPHQWEHLCHTVRDSLFPEY